MGLIKVDYDKAYRQAGRLQDAIRESEAACRQIDGVLKLAPSCWNGESRKQFEAELRAWKKEQQAIEQELQALKRIITETARNLEETEKRIIAEMETAKAAGNGGGGRGF